MAQEDGKPGTKPIDDFSAKIKNFMLESFVLQSRARLIERIETNEASDYLLLERDMLVQNLFIKKMRLDPGFRLKIFETIETDVKFLRKAEREILMFLETHVNLIKMVDIHAIDSKKYEFFTLNAESDVILEPRYNFAFGTPFIIGENKSKFFYCLWQLFMDKGQRQLACAAESVAFELLKRIHQGHHILKTSNPYAPSRNINAYHLQAMNVVLSRLGFKMFDFMEAQSKNLLLNEMMQEMISQFHFPALQAHLMNIINHFGDMLGKDLELLEKTRPESQILLLTAMLYFEGVDFDHQMQELGAFFGMPYITDRLATSPSLYPLDDPADLPFWEMSGLLPDLVPHIDRIRGEPGSRSEMDAFFLFKYLCKGLIESGDPGRAREIFHRQYPDLTTTELHIDDRIHLDLVFLLGEIACATKVKPDFHAAIGMLDDLKAKARTDHERNKFSIQQSMLYRMMGDYLGEYDAILALHIEKEQYTNDANPFEIQFGIMPAWEFFSENEDPSRITRYLHENGTPFFLEREPLIPVSHETYYIYFKSRELLYTSLPIDAADQVDHEDFANHFINQSLAAQSVACFKRVVAWAKMAEPRVKNNSEIALKKQFYETIAFPLLYLDQFEDAKERFMQALNVAYNDTYYLKYLVLIDAILDKVDEAAAWLEQLYALSERTRKYADIKGLFQALRLSTSQKQFENHIERFSQTKPIISMPPKTRCNVFQDIGYALADIGYLKEALEYFTMALNLAQDSPTKASILNNIGTVWTDLQDLDRAIELFKEAVSIDPTNFHNQMNLCEMHVFKNDFVGAKKYIESILPEFQARNDHSLPFLALLRTKMDLYINGILNVDAVKDEAARSHFLLARQFMININSIDQLKDNTGSIFMALENGFDCLFHATITPYVREALGEVYPEYPQKRIPDNEWDALNPGFKSALKGDHMSVGAIHRIFRDFREKPNDRLLSRVHAHLSPILSEEDMSIVESTAALMEKLRNPPGHGEVFSFDVFEKYHQPTTAALNRFISVVGKIPIKSI